MAEHRAIASEHRPERADILAPSAIITATEQISEIIAENAPTKQVFTTKEQVEQEVARLIADPRHLSLLLPPTDENNYSNFIRALALMFDMPHDGIWATDMKNVKIDEGIITNNIVNEDLLYMPDIDRCKRYKKFKSFFNSYEMMDQEESDYSPISMIWLYLFQPYGMNHYFYNDIFGPFQKYEGKLEYPKVAKAREDFLAYIRDHYASAEIYYHRIMCFLNKKEVDLFEYVNLEEANKYLWKA